MSEQREREDERAAEAPRGGKGRMERAGGPESGGVWPASGPTPPSDAEVRTMASFGQGERGAEGYEDHGESEAQTVPVEPEEETKRPGE